MGIDAERAPLSWPHVTLHCPYSHVQSHAQKFSKINCVNYHAPHGESDRRWLDSTPQRADGVHIEKGDRKLRSGLRPVARRYPPTQSARPFEAFGDLRPSVGFLRPNSNGKISGFGRFRGGAKAVGKVLRSKRCAFIADEDVTPLRAAARTKGLPASATPNEGPHFVPRFTAERTCAPRLYTSGHLRDFIFLWVSLYFTEWNLATFLGEQIGRKGVPIGET